VHLPQQLPLQGRVVGRLGELRPAHAPLVSSSSSSCCATTVAGGRVLGFIATTLMLLMLMLMLLPLTVVVVVVVVHRRGHGQRGQLLPAGVGTQLGHLLA
jgi:hypothetical protein